MPDTMPGSVSKGRIFRLLDHYLRPGSLPNARTALLNRLNKGDDINTILGALPAPPVAIGYNALDARELSHIDNHWFGSANKTRTYWPEQPEKDTIVREAYKKALLLSLGAGNVITVPIVSYWLCAGNHFEVVVCNDEAPGAAAPNQITVLIMTPSVAYRYLGRRRGLGSVDPDQNSDNTDVVLDTDEEIYVFASRRRINKVKNESRQPYLKDRGDKTITVTAAGSNAQSYQVIGDANMYADA